MNGGRIIGGLALLLLFLIAITAWDMWDGLLTVVFGGVSVLVTVLGAVMVWMGLKDLRTKSSDGAA
ncbi:MAG TPA: hypothetical protein DCZ72_09675 [Armatimonadetes bacterium]|nr:hypothetical protein [Armatimonadota bacterium]